MKRSTVLAAIVAGIAFGLTGCTKDNPVAPQLAGPDYECRSCLAGNYCPQFCTEKP